MFDISFAELMLIAVVGLLVIGPDKLPQVARSLGAFVGRLQRYVMQVKEEVNREARFEDLQKLQQEIIDNARQAKSSIMEGVNQTSSAVVSIQGRPQPKQPVKAARSPVKKAAVKKASVDTAVAKKPATKKSPSQIKNKTIKKSAVSTKVEKS
ncbi:MAG: twin-arginine translocase subunit TatB [Methylophilaceae bacterium]|nr:MAG: twin-arginine translocase subunit TatB [Methylophilaceae bacterium]